MNGLTITNFNGIETIESRLVAEAVEKSHTHLMRDIAKYCDYLNETKIGSVDFFIASDYTDSKGETRPCYLCTRKGCEMIANKLTGRKGVAFTAMYINAFHSMEKQIKQTKAVVSSADKQKRLEIQEKNARVRTAKLFMQLAKVDTLSSEYKNILVAKAAEELSGQPILSLPKSESKTYSATEIGNLLGVSAQKIGRIANDNGMKIPEYGEWYRDISPHSHKEIDSFRYNESAISRFREILSET